MTEWAGPSDADRRLLAIWGASLSAAGFLACRLFLEFSLRAHGAHTTGMLQYDSFYQFSFARELAREGRWLSFHNPFGTFDASPGLVNGPATLLRLTQPLWDGRLLAFDLVVGVVATAIAGWFFGRLVGAVARCGRTTAMVLVALAILGGGAGFVANSVGIAHNLEFDILGTTYWGPTWATTNIATWELIYHAVFWAGLAGLVERRVALPIVAAALLTFLHPFTITALGLTTFAVAAALFRGPTEQRPRFAAVTALLILPIAAAVIYDRVLPAHSHDAAFFHDVYRNQRFTGAAGARALYVAPVLLVVGAALVVARRGTRRSPPAVGLMAAAAVLAALAASDKFTDALPQPMHWARVYPIALALAAASSIIPRRERAFRAVVAATLLIALLDSGLAYRAMRNDLVGGSPAPPATVDADTQRLLTRLRALPAAEVAYVRDCAPATDFPGVEYVIGAVTQQHIPLGHRFFTPNLDRRDQQFLACRHTAESAIALRREFDYVIFDEDAARRLRIRGERIGRFVLAR